MPVFNCIQEEPCHSTIVINCIAGKFGKDLHKFGDLVSSLKLAKYNSSPNFCHYIYTVMLSMVLRKYLKKIQPEDKRKSSKDSTSMYMASGGVHAARTGRICNS